MAIVIFELDGDIDESAVELQFERKGSKIYVYGRVPRELTNAASLLGISESRNSIQDADCMLLDQVIRKRLQGSKEDSDGNVWELREIIDLPFECKTTFYNKYGHEISTYLLRKNDEGYAWGYFWVVGKHVGKKDDCPTKIRCRASSDQECDDDSESLENNSNQSRSDDEIEQMSIQYEVVKENNTNNQIDELKKELETQRLAHLNLLHDCETEIKQLKEKLEEKANEAAQYKMTADQCINTKIKELQACLLSKDMELCNFRRNMESEILGLQEHCQQQ